MTIDELDKENIRQRLINHQLEAKSERWRASLVAHVLKSSLPTAGKRKEKKKKKKTWDQAQYLSIVIAKL